MARMRSLSGPPNSLLIEETGTAMRPRALASALAADGSRASDKQRQHVCAARHERIRRLEMFPQFSLPDE